MFKSKIMFGTMVVMWGVDFNVTPPKIRTDCRLWYHEGDNKNRGKQLPIGSYFWKLNYTNLRGINKYEQGMVTLSR